MSITIEVLQTMLQEPPNGWWRFVPCATCRVLRAEPCVQGGATWPTPALRPHAPRVRSGLLLHATIWLLENGHADDVIGEPE